MKFLAFALPIVFLVEHSFSSSFNRVHAVTFSTLVSMPGGQSAGPSGNIAFDGSYIYGTTDPAIVGAIGTVYRVAADGSSFETLHSFDYPLGGYEPTGVTLVNGLLYGTTATGGPTVTGQGGTEGSGVLYSLSTVVNAFDILHTFRIPVGFPATTVISDGSALYGTTTASNPGAIYRANVDGTGFEVLHTFDTTSGSYPLAPLTLSGSTLYGTTSGFSALGNKDGTIFSMDTDGSGFQVLHTFTGTSQPIAPSALLLIGTTLYGTTQLGGASGDGMVFRMNVDGSGFQVLHSFSGGDGASPLTGLTYLNSHLYGTTELGGTQNDGVIFSLNPDGSGYDVVHSFSGSDGSQPLSALVGAGSTLFGTTSTGGANGAGTVFAIVVPEPQGLLLSTLGAICVVGITARRWWRR